MFLRVIIVQTSFVDFAYEDDIDVSVGSRTENVARVNSHLVRVCYCCA